MNRQELTTAYANKVHNLDPTSDQWREERVRLSKEYADELEELSRVEKRRMDQSILTGAGQEAERVGGIAT